MTRLFDTASLIKIFQIFDTLYSYRCDFALFDTIPCDTQLHPPDSSALLWWIFPFKAPLRCSIQKLYCQHLAYASQYNEVAPVNFRISKRLSYLIPPLLLKKCLFSNHRSYLIHRSYSIPKSIHCRCTVINPILITYHQISNIRCTKFQNLNVSCLILQLFLCNILKPGVKLRMKM